MTTSPEKQTCYHRNKHTERLLERTGKGDEVVLTGRHLIVSWCADCGQEIKRVYTHQ